MNQDNKSQPPLSVPTQPGQQRSQRFMALVLVFILILAGLGLSWHNHKNPSPRKTFTQKPESGLQTESELGDYKHEITITITAKGVSPQTLNIPSDTRIIWMNTDKVKHKLAITPGTLVPPKFDNFHQVDPGGGYPYVIHQAVTFHYYLVDNPKQGGTVIVKN